MNEFCFSDIEMRFISFRTNFFVVEKESSNES